MTERPKQEPTTAPSARVTALAADIRFERTIQMMRENRTQRMREQAAKEQNSDVQEFENTLRRLAGRKMQEPVDEDNLEETARQTNAFLRRIGSKRRENAKAKKEREIRRREVQQRQQSVIADLEKRRMDNKALQAMLMQSQLERTRTATLLEAERAKGVAISEREEAHAKFLVEREQEFAAELARLSEECRMESLDPRPIVTDDAEPAPLEDVVGEEESLADGERPLDPGLALLHFGGVSVSMVASLQAELDGLRTPTHPIAQTDPTVFIKAALVGGPCSGKHTVGHMVGEMLGLVVVDSDFIARAAKGDSALLEQYPAIKAIPMSADKDAAQALAAAKAALKTGIDKDTQFKVAAGILRALATDFDEAVNNYDSMDARPNGVLLVGLPATATDANVEQLGLGPKSKIAPPKETSQPPSRTSGRSRPSSRGSRASMHRKNSSKNLTQVEVPPTVLPLVDVIVSLTLPLAETVARGADKLVSPDGRHWHATLLPPPAGVECEALPDAADVGEAHGAWTAVHAKLVDEAHSQGLGADIVVPVPASDAPAVLAAITADLAVRHSAHRSAVVNGRAAAESAADTLEVRSTRSAQFPAIIGSLGDGGIGTALKCTEVTPVMKDWMQADGEYLSQFKRVMVASRDTVSKIESYLETIYDSFVQTLVRPDPSSDIVSSSWQTMISFINSGRQEEEIVSAVRAALVDVRDTLWAVADTRRRESELLWAKLVDQARITDPTKSSLVDTARAIIEEGLPAYPVPDQTVISGALDAMAESWGESPVAWLHRHCLAVADAQFAIAQVHAARMARMVDLLAAAVGLGGVHGLTPCTVPDARPPSEQDAASPAEALEAAMTQIAQIADSVIVEGEEAVHEELRSVAGALTHGFAAMVESAKQEGLEAIQAAFDSASDLFSLIDGEIVRLYRQSVDYGRDLFTRAEGEFVSTAMLTAVPPPPEAEVTAACPAVTIPRPAVPQPDPLPHLLTVDQATALAQACRTAANGSPIIAADKFHAVMEAQWESGTLPRPWALHGWDEAVGSPMVHWGRFIVGQMLPLMLEEDELEAFVATVQGLAGRDVTLSEWDGMPGPFLSDTRPELVMAECEPETWTAGDIKSRIVLAWRLQSFNVPFKRVLFDLFASEEGTSQALLYSLCAHTDPVVAKERGHKLAEAEIAHRLSEQAEEGAEAEEVTVEMLDAELSAPAEAGGVESLVIHPVGLRDEVLARFPRPPSRQSASTL
ncbi:RAD50 [Carpediemonas membranifera]|uniref:RAD50 n=1 Tax=Carpediemonas membranifera TaxID=201153 RepID=A0A8J6B0I0_9EUKA|nr:RAD50 [Carpediemonas membranifera]|eukprot:KAG9392898.1 RAD50 [Carpediemonas membranifera]